MPCFEISSKKTASLIVLTIVVIILFVLFTLEFFEVVYIDIASSSSTFSLQKHQANDEIFNNFSINIPRIVHHTWKGASLSLPSELTRWKKGCIKLNPDYEFRMYNDQDLLTFAKQHYPRYFSMFQTLHGVCKFDSITALFYM